MNHKMDIENRHARDKLQLPVSTLQPFKFLKPIKTHSVERMYMYTLSKNHKQAGIFIYGSSPFLITKSFRGSNTSELA